MITYLEINLIFLIKTFFLHDQKVEYLGKEERFKGEIKSIVYLFWRVFIEVNKKIFFGG